MSARHALLAVLAAGSLTGCPASTGCDPLDEAFSIDEALSAEQLDQIVSNYGLLDRDAITCNMACSVACGRASGGWHAGATETCTFTPAPHPSWDARVSCTGIGYEYVCFD